MTFRINSELPVKYPLNVHSALPSYPTQSDFIFDVATHLVRVADVKGKDWDVDDIKFSTKTLKYVFGDRMNDDQFKASLKNILAGLLDSGTLIKRGEYIFIPNVEFSKYYLIA
jgi:hypothetical protein